MDHWKNKIQFIKFSTAKLLNISNPRKCSSLVCYTFFISLIVDTGSEHIELNFRLVVVKFGQFFFGGGAGIFLPIPIEKNVLNKTDSNLISGELHC